MTYNLSILNSINANRTVKSDLVETFSHVKEPVLYQLLYRIVSLYTEVSRRKKFPQVNTKLNTKNLRAVCLKIFKVCFVCSKNHLKKLNQLDFFMNDNVLEFSFCV